jgi:hypothetical protein
VLCAIVGFLTNRALQESEKRLGPATPIACDGILETHPTETSRILITDFIPGKHFAVLDYENDEQWEQLCVPMFPKKRLKITHSYRAVLVCFNNVPDRESFRELADAAEIDTNYWPMRQNLDAAIHSQLAQQYKNLDFANSPVLHCGFETSNPVLGATSLKLSIGVGATAIFTAFIALLAGLFFKPRSESLDGLMTPEQNTNRAGLPNDNQTIGCSVLDRVNSMRDQQTVA